MANTLTTKAPKAVATTEQVNHFNMMLMDRIMPLGYHAVWSKGWCADPGAFWLFHDRKIILGPEESLPDLMGDICFFLLAALNRVQGNSAAIGHIQNGTADDMDREFILQEAEGLLQSKAGNDVFPY